MQEEFEQAATKRRGRKRRLSPEAILHMASQIIAQGGIRDFSMPRLAKSMSVGVMSLYTYFPSRDDLLLALAESIYDRFETPEPQGSWQGDISAWLWAMVRHFDRYPESLLLIHWNGHASPGWLRRWFPIAVLLKRQGMAGPHLAFAMSWFTNASMSFISSEMTSRARRHAGTLAHVDRLDPEDRRLATELWLDFCDLDRDDILAFGFGQIVQGLGDLIDGDYPRARPAGEASLARIVEHSKSGKLRDGNGGDLSQR